MTPAALVVSLLLEMAVKGSLLLVGVGIVALAMRHRTAADRHLAWTLGLVGLLVLPVLSIVGPDWPVALPEGAARVLPRLVGDGGPPSPGEESGSSAGTASAAAAGSRSQDAALAAPVGDPRAPDPVRSDQGRPALGPAHVIAALWLLGAAAILASFLRAWSHLAGVARRATPLDDGRWRARAAHAAREVGLDVGRVILRRATEAVTPLTWGAVRPVVILPPSAEGWTGEQARTVLVHELSHIRRHDCLTQTLASLACVLHWFNPLAWLAARRMLTERERACDDQVLLAGAKASDYANDLLEIARSLGAPWSTSQVSTAMARRSQIAGRLLAVLDPHLARGGTSRGRVILAASLGLALLLPLAVVRAAPSGAGVPGPTTVVVSPSPGPIDLLRVRRELEDRHQRLEMALRRGDTEALALHYTADAEVVVPLLPVARGRGGVRDLYEHLVSAGVSAVDHEILDLYPVGGLVCEIAITRFRASSGAVVQSSRDMTLWRQEDGEWRVHREVSVPRGGEEKR